MRLSGNYPRLKAKGFDNDQRLFQLQKDLASMKKDLLKECPPSFTAKKLDSINYRVFAFPKTEIAGELYVTQGRKKYVCIDSKIAKRSYYSALQFALHGTVHAFSHFRDPIADEAYCEYLSYKVLSTHLAKKGEKYRRRILRSIMRLSSPDYNMYLRAARRVEESHPGLLRKLNNKARHRNIAKAKERRIFRKYVKHKSTLEGEVITVDYELERGFRTIR
jgi:hypothetical protein